MPDDRLERTRRAYEDDRGPTWQEIVYALPGLPPMHYRVTTDPITGITTRERLPDQFVVTPDDDLASVRLSPSFVQHLREKEPEPR